MEFCPTDGALLVPRNNDGKVVVACPICGHESKNKANGKIKETLEESENLSIMDSNEEFKKLPKVEIECPNCSHGEAAYWEEQTRSSDEPPTKFYKCTKCKHQWRDYN